MDGRGCADRLRLAGRVDDAQSRDKETGERIWLVTVIDLEEADDSVRFRRSAEYTVRVVASAGAAGASDSGVSGAGRVRGVDGDAVDRSDTLPPGSGFEVPGASVVFAAGHGVGIAE